MSQFGVELSEANFPKKNLVFVTLPVFCFQFPPLKLMTFPPLPSPFPSMEPKEIRARSMHFLYHADLLLICAPNVHPTPILMPRKKSIFLEPILPSSLVRRNWRARNEPAEGYIPEEEATGGGSGPETAGPASCYANWNSPEDNGCPDGCNEGRQDGPEGLSRAARASHIEYRQRHEAKGGPEGGDPQEGQEGREKKSL